jgi:hypothetical protein
LRPYGRSTTTRNDQKQPTQTQADEANAMPMSGADSHSPPLSRKSGTGKPSPGKQLLLPLSVAAGPQPARDTRPGSSAPWSSDVRQSITPQYFPQSLLLRFNGSGRRG